MLFLPELRNMCLRTEKSPRSEQHNERKPTKTIACGYEILEHTRTKEEILNISTQSYKLGHIRGQGINKTLVFSMATWKTPMELHSAVWKSLVKEPTIRLEHEDEKNVVRPESLWNFTSSFFLWNLQGEKLHQNELVKREIGRYGVRKY